MFCNYVLYSMYMKVSQNLMAILLFTDTDYTYIILILQA